MKLTCLFDSVCSLLFLLCWTNIFRDFVLDVTSIHDTCILVTSSTKSRKILVQQRRNKREHTLSNRQVNFILNFIFYYIFLL